MTAYQKDPTRAVVTRDGRKVRILCTDMKDPVYPVVAIVADTGGYEKVLTYTPEGMYIAIGDDREAYNNLYFEEAATVEEAAREYAGKLIGKILKKFPTDAAGNYYLTKGGMKYLLARLFDEGVVWRDRREESHKDGEAH